MPEFAETVLAVLTADTPAAMSAPALAALSAQLAPQQAALLIWDPDLGRYILGGTWQHPGDTLPPPTLRRAALRLAADAQSGDQVTARVLSAPQPLPPMAVYQPLNKAGRHVGALLFSGLDQPPTTDDHRFALLMHAVTHGLYTAQRLQHAESEHAELESERARLEGLLRAVEQQGQTIDRLLAAERHFSAQLEAEVEARTRDLRAAQDQLIQSEKLAVIGRLASSLAHELRNPMQAIQSGLELVLDDLPADAPPATREDLRIIQAELERIEGIFSQMLDFYRPAHVQDRPLDLNAIIADTQVLLRKRLAQHRVQLVTALHTPLPSACGDKNQIKQVLINLILNAADAMPDSGGMVRLVTLPTTDGVALRVEDTGCGIAAAHLSQLFEPLFTTKTRGLGLGLAITQEIVTRHGGQISVESVVGQGTTFTVTLPTPTDCPSTQQGAE